jgi:5-methyltetrahydrofolate--homocysteine methyltransferase
VTVLPLPSTLPRPIVADGATGTALLAAGLPAGASPEAWLLTPVGAAALSAVHRDHVRAGSRLILTSTLGANALRLAGSPQEGRTREICRAAVAAARAAAPPPAGPPAAALPAAAEPGVIVAGSMGPSGSILAPVGTLDPGAARAAYAEQADALVEAGVDLLWVETMMDLGEALAAVDGAREAAPGVPVVATLVFRRGRTMFGDRPAAVATALAEHGAVGIGANCGDGFAPVEEVIPLLAAAAPGLHVIAKANAGIPVVGANGRAVYAATPAEAAGYAERMAAAGATIIGGCCGTTAEHVAAIAAALAD